MLKLLLHRLGLLRKRVDKRPILDGSPSIEAIHLVERDDKWCLLRTQHVQRLDGLRLEAVHNVDDEDGNVAEGRATRAQIGEGLVTWSVDDHQPWHLDLDALPLSQTAHSFAQRVCREERRADLLSDPTRLAILHVRPPDVVEQFRLPSIHVAHDTYDPRSKPIGCHRCLRHPRALFPGCARRGLSGDQLVVLIRGLIAVVIVAIVIFVIVALLKIVQLVHHLLFALLRILLLLPAASLQCRKPA
mmetsp:Transcript_20887/g.46789  ORF Transcript_20887/g.46789 Transcript_20887/m.46789 type:complete len:245 (+) Transcript_20887:1899-2633(+)